MTTNIVKTVEVEQVAEELHRIQCRFDHTDQCGWYYGAAHRQNSHYMKKAESMLADTPLTADVILAVLKEV